MLSYSRRRRVWGWGGVVVCVCVRVWGVGGWVCGWVFCVGVVVSWLTWVYNCPWSATQLYWVGCSVSIGQWVPLKGYLAGHTWLRNNLKVSHICINGLVCIYRRMRVLEGMGILKWQSVCEFHITCHLFLEPGVRATNSLCHAHNMGITADSILTEW